MRLLWNLSVGLVLALAPVSAEDTAARWPQWRGPQANGIAAAEELPTSWSRGENVAWYTSTRRPEVPRETIGTSAACPRGMLTGSRGV